MLPTEELPAQIDVARHSALAAWRDAIWCQAAMVVPARQRRRRTAYGGHNDFATTVLLAQMFAGVRRLVLARRW